MKSRHLFSRERTLSLWSSCHTCWCFSKELFKLRSLVQPLDFQVSWMHLLISRSLKPHRFQKLSGLDWKTCKLVHFTKWRVPSRTFHAFGSLMNDPPYPPSKSSKSGQTSWTGSPRQVKCVCLALYLPEEFFQGILSLWSSCHTCWCFSKVLLKLKSMVQPLDFQVSWMHLLISRSLKPYRFQKLSGLDWKTCKLVCPFLKIEGAIQNLPRF